MFQKINGKKSLLITLITTFSLLTFAQEKHLKNIKQLTFGGDNAEAYFSPKGDKLTLQVTNKAFGVSCDQIFMLDLQAKEFNEKSLQLVSTGKGRTTCSFYMPDGKHIIYASTHAANHACPAPPKPIEGKYLWAIYPEFEIYMADLNGNIVKQLTNSPGYDAEAVVSPDGKKIYIATNIPGGFGGFDIYEATITEDGTIGNLVNLGPNVNTADDEKYPYLSSDNKYLYFSSKGHLNLGGYDVFRSAYVENSFLPAMNLGTDLNSRRDDVAFVMTSPSKGYISTDKKQSGNFDILKFEIKKQENLHFSYTVVEEVTKTALPNATVVVTDEFGTKLAETQSDNDGKIKLVLEPLTTYNVVVNKDGYETKKLNIATGDTDKNIALTQKKAVVTEDAIVIENIYFDFNKSTIKKESELSLNKIVEVLKNNTGMSISINAHTDSKGSDTYNQTLSESRAKSAYQYLIKKGIPASQLTYKGFGESELLEKCEKCSAEQDQRNRRVEFKIVK